MKAFLYRKLMRFAHRHGWHHITRSQMENGDVQNWCHWCGLRETLKHDHLMGMKVLVDAHCRPNEILLTNLKMPQGY